MTDPGIVKCCLNWDFSAAKLGDCIAFPYRTPDRQKTGFARVRPDKPRMRGGKSFKYESPVGMRQTLLFSYRNT